MDLQLIDKTALVTGSTAGIGLEIGRKLAVEGAKVIVTGRNQAKLDRAVETIRAGGHWQARFFGCNPHEDDLTQARRRSRQPRVWARLLENDHVARSTKVKLSDLKAI